MKSNMQFNRISTTVSKAVLLVDNSYSLRMVSAFERIADSLPLSYKIVTFNIDSTRVQWTRPKIGKSGNELKTWVANEEHRESFNKLLAKLSSTYNTKVFIIACEAANLFVSGYSSLDKTRGSRYDYLDYKCFVIDKPL